MSRPRSGIHTYAGSYLRDGRYVEALTSPGVESLLGGPLETGIEAAWDAALHPDDRTTYREAISYATLVRGEPLDIEYRLVGSDGVTRWVWERVTPRPPRGEAVDVDGVIVDISERKEVNRVLEEHRFLSDALLMESGTDIFSGLYLPDGTYVDHYPAGIEHVLGRRLAPGEDGGEAWAAAVSSHVEPGVRWAGACSADWGDPK